jgi:hypothetical protein
MDNPLVGVSTLSTQDQGSVELIETGSPSDQFRHALGRFSDDHLDGWLVA